MVRQQRRIDAQIHVFRHKVRRMVGDKQDTAGTCLPELAPRFIHLNAPVIVHQPGCRPASEAAAASRSAAASNSAKQVAPDPDMRSEEHTSELQSLMRISYAVFCFKKKTTSNCT